MSFLNDQEFLLAKRTIFEKIHQLLGLVEQELHQGMVRHQFPPGVLVNSGKISRGDCYQGLPYMVLDYPRAFRKEDIFAFRTMFWWGHNFSATLHLSGNYLQYCRPRLINKVPNMAKSKAYICVNSNPWEYHFQSDNYRPASGFSQSALQRLVKEKPFVKISYQWPLKDFQELPQNAGQAFQELTGWALGPEN